MATVIAVAAASLLACGDTPEARGAGAASVTSTRSTADAATHGGASAAGMLAREARAMLDTTVPSLARAAGGTTGREYATRDVSDGGVVSGTVTTSATLPSDTTIVPTHDLTTCARFVERPFPVRDGGVGNAVVWLAGVASGPPSDVPRRATIALRDCHLEPRVQRIAAGGTVLVNSRDAMMSRLRFTEIGTGTVRASVHLNDAGQVVPSDLASGTAGLVLVTDDLHPWVRGFLAVAPHPFVAVTEAGGDFRFERVPPGTYTLVVWHERLGTASRTVTVRSGETVDGALRLR